MLGKNIDLGGENHNFYSTVSKSYFDLMSTDNLRVDHVLAIVNNEKTLPVWHTYKRLLMPIKLIDDTPAVADTGEFSVMVSIPFMQ